MHTSIWVDLSPGKRFKPLSESIETDILIIGGGLTGISTALELSNTDLNITLIDSNQIGYGTSGRNTGKVTPQAGLVYSKIKNYYGLEKAKYFYQENLKALNKIKENISKYHIECDFAPAPSFIFSKRSDRVTAFEEEYKVYEEIGIEGELTHHIDLPIDVEVALSQTHAGIFNPKKYLDGLIPILLKRNIKIYESTPVTDIQKSDSGWRAIIDGHLVITARQVLFCSHYPFYDHYSFYFTRLKPEKSYIVAGLYDKSFPQATFIDEDDPVRSLCPYRTNNQTWLLIAGENHKVGQSNTNHFDRLKGYGLEVFGLSNYQYAWSAQGYVTPDSIPYIGYLNEHDEELYVATGFNKWGNLNSTIAAHQLCDLVLNRKSNDAGVYDPSRKRGYFTAAYISDNVNSIYELVKSHMTSTSTSLPKENDSASVVELDGKKYGAYKDDNGELHIVDIVCPHVGTQLNWNSIERTWDCPAHGSRFSYDGDIIEGPSTHRLNKYLEEPNKIDPHIIN